MKKTLLVLFCCMLFPVQATMAAETNQIRTRGSARGKPSVPVYHSLLRMCHQPRGSERGRCSRNVSAHEIRLTESPNAFHPRPATSRPRFLLSQLSTGQFE